MSLTRLRHRELRQAGQFRTRFAGPDPPDRLGSQPPRRESRRLPGRLTQPLPFIDHAHQRLLSGHLREQAERGQPDQEPVFTNLSQELLSRCSAAPESALWRAQRHRLRSDRGPVRAGDLAELQDDSLRRTIEVDVTIAMAALDVLGVVILDREADTAGLTDLGQAARTTICELRPDRSQRRGGFRLRNPPRPDASARLEPRPPPVRYVSGQPAGQGRAGG